MLRDDDGVEPGLLGGDGVLDECLGMELFVATEVGKASQRALLVGNSQPRRARFVRKSRNATVFAGNESYSLAEQLARE